MFINNYFLISVCFFLFVTFNYLTPVSTNLFISIVAVIKNNFLSKIIIYLKINN